MRYKSAPHIAWQTIGGCAVVVDLRDGVGFGLNGTGSSVWEDLERGDSTETIASNVARKFELSLEEARLDVTTFVAMLAERALIVER